MPSQVGGSEERWQMSSTFGFRCKLRSQLFFYFSTLPNYICDWYHRSIDFKWCTRARGVTWALPVAGSYYNQHIWCCTVLSAWMYSIPVQCVYHACAQHISNDRVWRSMVSWLRKVVPSASAWSADRGINATWLVPSMPSGTLAFSLQAQTQLHQGKYIFTYISFNAARFSLTL